MQNFDSIMSLDRIFQMTVPQSILPTYVTDRTTSVMVTGSSGYFGDRLVRELATIFRKVKCLGKYYKNLYKNQKKIFDRN